MWKRKLNRRWLCAVMAVVLLAEFASFPGGKAVMAKGSREVKAVDTVSGNQTLADIEQEKETLTKIDKETEEGTTSGNEVPREMEAEESAKETEMPDLPDKQENTNITFPSRLEVAFNPLGLPVGTGGGSYSTAQVISSDYVIINKGSADAVVTVTIHVEDLNDGQIVFVDSPGEVEAAGKDVYAVYLSVILADGVGIDGETAVPVHEGENEVSFRIPADGGRAAFIFDGVMNGDAEWWELSHGIKISTVYSCGTVKRTGAVSDKADAPVMEE